MCLFGTKELWDLVGQKQQTTLFVISSCRMVTDTREEFWHQTSFRALGNQLSVCLFHWLIDFSNCRLFSDLCNVKIHRKHASKHVENVLLSVNLSSLGLANMEMSTLHFKPFTFLPFLIQPPNPLHPPRKQMFLTQEGRECSARQAESKGTQAFGYHFPCHLGTNQASWMEGNPL